MMLSFAGLYTALGMRDKAEVIAHEFIALCQQELEQRPDHAVAAWTGALAAAFLGKQNLAMAWAKRALAIEPDDHLTLYNVACAYSLLRLQDGQSTCSANDA